jgi:hypothetical protein
MRYPPNEDPISSAIAGRIVALAAARAAYGILLGRVTFTPSTDYDFSRHHTP